MFRILVLSATSAFWLSYGILCPAHCPLDPETKSFCRHSDETMNKLAADAGAVKDAESMNFINIMKRCLSHSDPDRCSDDPSNLCMWDGNQCVLDHAAYHYLIPEVSDGTCGPLWQCQYTPTEKQCVERTDCEWTSGCHLNSTKRYELYYGPQNECVKIGRALKTCYEKRSAIECAGPDNDVECTWHRGVTCEATFTLPVQENCLPEARCPSYTAPELKGQDEKGCKADPGCYWERGGSCKHKYDWDSYVGNITYATNSNCAKMWALHTTLMDCLNAGRDGDADACFQKPQCTPICVKDFGEVHCRFDLGGAFAAAFGEQYKTLTSLVTAITECAAASTADNEKDLSNGSAGATFESEYSGCEINSSDNTNRTSFSLKRYVKNEAARIMKLAGSGSSKQNLKIAMVVLGAAILMH